MPTLRRAGTTSVITLATVGVSCAVAYLSVPHLGALKGWDFWNLPVWRQQLHEAYQRRADLNAYEEWIAQRSENANHIARKLLYGYPLAAATEDMMLLFHDDAAMPVFLDHYYAKEPTRRHRYARHTIDRALRFVDHDTPQRQSVLARLNAEYATFDASPPAPAEPPR